VQARGLANGLHGSEATLLRLRAVIDKRLVFVCGKGGVGRSTVAAALGLLSARRGRRTIIAEVAGQDQAGRVLGDGTSPERFSEHAIGDGLWGISIDPPHATREYLADQLPVRAMADLVAGSDTFGYFAAAAPGLHELVTIGKIWELALERRRTSGADPYDTVIVDAPASGHAVAIMRTPQTFADIAMVGPIARQARHIQSSLSDAQHTGVVAVALPADMPVNETIALAGSVREAVGLGLDAVVANAVYPRRFAARQVPALRRVAGGDGPPLPRAAARAALSQHARADRHRVQLRRLREALEPRPIVLPFLFAPELGRPEIEHLADLLEAGL